MKRRIDMSKDELRQEAYKIVQAKLLKRMETIKNARSN